MNANILSHRPKHKKVSFRKNKSIFILLSSLFLKTDPAFNVYRSYKKNQIFAIYALLTEQIRQGQIFHSDVANLHSAAVHIYHYEGQPEELT